MGTVENQQGQDIDDNWVKDRKKEFEELIDSNHDGMVTMEELEVSKGTHECCCVPGRTLGLEARLILQLGTKGKGACLHDAPRQCASALMSRLTRWKGPMKPVVCGRHLGICLLVLRMKPRASKHAKQLFYHRATSQPCVKRFLSPLMGPEKKTHISPASQVTLGLPCKYGSCGLRASLTL